MNSTLTEIIAATLHLPQSTINDQLTMAEVDGWDSLQHMNLIASLELAYNTEFSFEEIISMQSVMEIKCVLRNRGVDV